MPLTGLLIPRNRNRDLIFFLSSLMLMVVGILFAEEEEKPVAFAVIQSENDKEIVGILKMHFKEKFEAEWDSGLFLIDFSKIEQITPVDPAKQKIALKLVSGEEVDVKLINALYLDKTVFGKYEINLAKIKKIIRKK